MDSLIRFGLGSMEAYDFIPARQTEYQDNFSNILQAGVTVPGKDGVISPYGMGRGPAESGNVSVRFWVFGDEIGEMGHTLNQVKAMAYWGVRRLFKLSQSGELMWTWASVSSIQTPQVVRRMPHLRQQVQMTFQCPESKWYNADGMAFLNDDATFSTGLQFPAMKVDQQTVSNGTVVSVINRGNSPVSAYVRWDGNGVDSFSNPVITRENWLEETVNQLTYTATIGANDVVEIDARYLKCTDISKLTRLSGDWLTIPSGTWDLTVTGTFTTNAKLTVDFWDGWV